MKIATVTFYDGRTNYGQALQCYALVKFLKSMGHDVFYIRYDNSVPLKKGLLKELLSNIYHWILNPLNELDKRKKKKIRRELIRKDMEHPRGFDAFMKQYIPSSQEVFNKNTPYSTFPYADAYFCGSDQIWGGADPIYFLQFTPKGSKRIAYAPSFGGYIPDGKKKDIIRSYIKSFDLITCREKTGTKLCGELGRNDAILFPDPTILLSSKDYGALSKEVDISVGEFIFLYLLGNEIDLPVEDIFRYAESANKKIIYVASQGRVDEFPKFYPTIGEWLYLIDHASCVITNSFHGTVFCLQFRKKFLTIPLSGKFAKQNDRIYDLLEKYNLSDRIYDGNLNHVMNELDFSSFERVQKDEIHMVKNILSKHIS